LTSALFPCFVHSKLAPYGLGNNQRSKREASVEVSSRCVCRDSADGTCTRFCKADSSKDYRSVQDTMVFVWSGAHLSRHISSSSSSLPLFNILDQQQLPHGYQIIAILMDLTHVSLYWSLTMLTSTDWWSLTICTQYVTKNFCPSHIIHV